jgi:hypothetical protein
MITEARIERNELSIRLTRGLDQGSVVLLADAGFGKTSALEQALAAWSGTAIWLHPTHADRDPGRPGNKSRPTHTVRNATVGGIRDARTAGIRPANAPIRMAAAMPPDHASMGITTDQLFEVA